MRFSNTNGFKNGVTLCRECHKLTHNYKNKKYREIQ